LAAGSHPKYLAGLQFGFRFGSNVYAERVVHNQAQKDLEETRLGRFKQERLDQLAQAERKVEAEHSIAESSKQQKQYRQQAVKELTRSYSLGRIDIRLLIDAINSEYETEIGYWRAIGDYQIALNQWAALRDELIPDQGVE